MKLSIRMHAAPKTRRACFEERVTRVTHMFTNPALPPDRCPSLLSQFGN
jgi:hypothetical protein